MSVIVTCSCSAKVRLPEEGLGKPFRCPRCRTEFVATADAQVVRLAPVSETTTGTLCPICQATVQAGEVALTCPSCRQVHHRDCWAEVGGCSTYGCPQAPVVDKAEGGPQPPLTAWGDTKTCPVCGEQIKAIALRCRYCGTDFDTVDPLTVRDLGKRARKQENLKSLRTELTILFVCSLLGCTAPVVLLFGLIWFLPKRQTAAKAGPVYAVLGYAALAISGVFTLLIVLFLVFSQG